MAKKKETPQLRVIPLGGLEEIGKNMTVFEYGDDLIVVDCGLSFPSESMPGVDLVIPDISYLQKNKEKIRAFLITHGHEDHIGALPLVLSQLGVRIPVYGTKLTLGLIELKLREHRMTDTPLIAIEPGQMLELGNFSVEFLHVNHSICGAVAMAITSPVGTIVYTGDFKIDFTPVDGQVTDLQRFAQIGAQGVLALFMDSTNAERAGYTTSERMVGEMFNTYFAKATGRIIVAMFASNVHRIQQVFDAAVRCDRYVVLNGRSMVNIANLARDLGELEIPEGRLIDVDDVDFYDEDEIVILTTGSQGEELAGLTRMAFSEHRKLDIAQDDMVIVSATPIPGNEKYVSRVINQLFNKGADVVYEALEDVHVSGHACQEELKIIHALVKPRYFIPTHGESKHLHSHQHIAQAMGMPKENIFRLKNGDVLCFDAKGGARLDASVPSGAVMVDGLGIGDVGNVVLKDRKHLSQDGILVVSVAVNSQEDCIAQGPELISRGFVYVKESEELMEQARAEAVRIIEGCIAKGHADPGTIRNRLKDDLRTFMYQKTKRSPMILPVVMLV